MTIYDESETAKTPYYDLADGTGEQQPTAVYVNDQDGSGERLVWQASTGPNYGSTVTRPADDRTSTGQTGYNGVTINPNTELRGVRVMVSANTTQLERFGIQPHASGANWILDELHGPVTAGETVDLIIPNSADYLQAGTEYDILASNNGNGYTRGSYQNATYPYTSTDVDATGGMFSTGSSSATNWYNLSDVTAILP